jgi:serine/threonine-protein kinase
VVLPDPGSSLVGKLLDDRYEILEIIGGGGVGVVYSARRVKLERTVAVKVLHESLVNDAGFVGRFQREAVAMSRLHHPHCLAVIDFGVHESRPYLVLEYVPGENVRKLLERGRFSAQRAANIALQLLETLEYFHAHHVIHRDLKSENVMLVESGGTADFVKVLDFGMAKIISGPGADSQLSKIGLVPGTPSAMAPEQIYQLPPDPRIDIYATGILLYEMIVGRRPFSGADMASTIKMQLSESPKSPREILGEGALSAELEQVILRALEKDRIDRYGTASEMFAALKLTPEVRAMTAASAATPIAAEPMAQRGAARKRRALVLAGVSTVLALGAVAAVALQSKPPPPAPLEPPVVVIAEAVQQPAAVPPPVPVVETWLAHRDLAVTYGARGQHDDAFREVTASIADNPSAAAADPSLVTAAVNALAPKRVAFVVDAFRANPKLTEALAQTTARGATAELRHAAHDGLRALEQESQADLVAMWILDVEQATSCSTMRSAFKKIRAANDPRLSQLKAELRKRDRKDPHARCLKRLIKR